jgi:hypothetical protein
VSNQIVNLKTGASTSVPSVTGNFLIEDGSFQLQPAERVGEAVQDQLEDLKTIYGEPSANLSRAIEIISESIDSCVKAIESVGAGDKIQADSYMLQTQAVLPELFKLRQISDGFGIICSALMFSFVNRAGRPFQDREIHAVLRGLRALWSTPYLSIWDAVCVTDDLEQAGLIVDPIQLTALFTYAEEAGLVDG